jgi:Flp pilus assembly protein TadD
MLPALAAAALAALLFGSFAGRELMANRLMREALRFRKAGNLQEAAVQLKKAGDLEVREFTPQTSVGVWYELGETYRQGGALELSAEAYRRDLLTNPHSPEVHNMLGANLGQLGQARPELREEAAAHLREAIRLSPDYSGAYLNLGIAYATMGNLTGAARAWNDLLAMDPKNVDAKAYLEQLKKMGKR